MDVGYIVEIDGCDTRIGEHISGQDPYFATKCKACKSRLVSEQTFRSLVKIFYRIGIENLTIEGNCSKWRINERSFIITVIIKSVTQRFCCRTGFVCESSKSSTSVKHAVADSLQCSRNRNVLDRKIVEHIVHERLHLWTEGNCY